MTKWVSEDLHGGHRQSLRVDKMLHSGTTQFQDVEIFENDLLGRVLALDGIIQTTESDEFYYHEMLAHVPLFAVDAPRDVLIIGGGDGGCLEEVLKHPIDKATMVDLDGEVVELAKTYLPKICGKAFDDPRTDLRIGDGAAFVAGTSERYDIIIVDSTDPIGPGAVLFSNDFYRNCRRCLNNGGVLITQNGVPAYQYEELRKSLDTFKRHYDYSGCYRVAVPTYFGGDMALGWAGANIDLSNSDRTVLSSRYGQSGIKTRYYNPGIHQAAFELPNFLL